MMSRIKHFLVYIPLNMMLYSLPYGASAGTVVSVIWFILGVKDEVDTWWITVLFCSPFIACLGAFAGASFGIIIGLVDGFATSLISFIFWWTDTLWQRRVLYRNCICVVGIALNGGVMTWFFPAQPTLLAIIIIFTGITTIFLTSHFERWHFDYLVKYPEILYATELDFYHIASFDDFTDYELSLIPDELAYFADGELPAEILSQFPTYK